MEPTICTVISKEEMKQWLDWLVEDGLGADIVAVLKAIPVVQRKRGMKAQKMLVKCTYDDEVVEVTIKLSRKGKAVARFTCPTCKTFGRSGRHNVFVEVKRSRR